MSEFSTIPVQRPATVSIFYLLATTLLGFYFIGPLLGILIVAPFVDGNLIEFLQRLRQPLGNPEMKLPLMFIQGCATLFGMIAGPALYWILYEKRSVRSLFSNAPISLLVLVLTGLITIIFIVPNSVIIDWNSKLHLPDVLRGLEDWAHKTEDLAAELTQFMTSFGSAGEFVLGFVVIAVLPGIGEELVFRGMLQTKLLEVTKNPHLAIWISAILFSALHLQFFGFVPRVFLGAMFGYLYYWSGNIVVPIVAHFINNAFMVVMLYLHQLGKITMDIESANAAPWPAVISGTILTFGLLVYIKKLLDRNLTNR